MVQTKVRPQQGHHGANLSLTASSSHPKELPDHVEFSFMSLVYPDDQALVLSMWNTLLEGTPVTFEMRWKPRPGTDDIAQWVLSACVPVLDDEGNLISIAGNTIDINVQKKSQAVAQAQVAALEQARLSELKFARFAQLSPTAIYIYIPETGRYSHHRLGSVANVVQSGMKFVNDQFYELTGHTRTPLDQFTWFDYVAEEDVEKVGEDWANLLGGKRSDGVQFRLKKTWINQDGISSNIYVQSSSYDYSRTNCIGFTADFIQLS